jgi:hypothetical protein
MPPTTAPNTTGLDYDDETDRTTKAAADGFKYYGEDRVGPQTLEPPQEEALLKELIDTILVPLIRRLFQEQQIAGAIGIRRKIDVDPDVHVRLIHGSRLDVRRLLARLRQCHFDA